MSCYMQDREQTAKVAAYLTHAMNVTNGIPGMLFYFGEKQKAEAKNAVPGWYDEKHRLWLREPLFKAMWEMNRDSVVARYGEGAKDEMVGDFEPLGDVVYDTKEDNLRHWATRLYKALSNYLYQSCEGDCDKRPLYKFLERCHNTLAHTLAGFMCKDEGAEWSCWN